MSRNRIAVVGSGIAGLSAAWLLSKRHDVTLIEADTRLGGHSNTVDAVRDGRKIPVDTGFIVYNTASYPNLIALFDQLPPQVPLLECVVQPEVSPVHKLIGEPPGSGVATIVAASVPKTKIPALLVVIMMVDKSLRRYWVLGANAQSRFSAAPEVAQLELEQARRVPQPAIIAL